jgi:hypothetical protein
MLDLAYLCIFTAPLFLAIGLYLNEENDDE